jgi:ankyrin repeat protein
MFLRAIAQTTCIVSLKHAIRAGNVEHVWLALESGEIIDDTLFKYACQQGSTEIVRLLFEPERGVDPSTADNHALIIASIHGHTEIVRLLLDLPLERGVDPSARDNMALRCASENGRTKIVRLLLDLPLERGVNPATNDNYALRKAGYYGHTEIVRLLLICRWNVE